jgi:hypothetical protein
MMKTAKVVATFPDVLDSVNIGIVLTGEATSSSIRSAVSRALAEILKSPELKRKRIHNINLTVEITNKENAQ